MNLNDFVVLPNNKAKSIKFNARNLQELQMETVTLAQESKEMEEKLQQLKESMSREKEERGHSGGFRWKSGQCGSLNSSALTIGAKKDKENRLQKLSAGKVKIRVLKDEPLTAPPQPPPPPPPATTGSGATRKSRLSGATCGQCEVKTAGVICAECTENYCMGCFAKFHHKGALKLHRMILMQAEIQTHVSTRDVVSRYPRTFTNPDPCPTSKPSPSHVSTSSARTRRGEQNPGEGMEAVAKPAPLHPDTSQVLFVNHGEETNPEMVKEGLKREDERGFAASLLKGEYNEEEAARAFQEALRQWRGEPSDDAVWIPVRPASVSAMATQADLLPERGAEGRGSPVMVEFTENSLTYMDRLLLKKHRRTPVERHDPSLSSGPDLKSLPDIETEEESSLTAQEEDFRRYCASLFAVPVSRGRTEAPITTSEPCLIIEVLDETDTEKNRSVAAEQKTNNHKRPPLPQQGSSNRRTLMPRALTDGGLPRVGHSSPSPAQPSRQSGAPAHPQTARKLRPSQSRALQAKHVTKLLPSESMPSPCPTTETPRTSQPLSKAATSKLQKPGCSPTVYKVKADRQLPWLLSSSPLSQDELLKLSHSPLSFPPNVSPLATTRSSTPKGHFSASPSTSFSLRSTFTVSPSSSTESSLLPEVYHPNPLQKSSDSSRLPEQLQSSKLFLQPTSLLKLSQLPSSNLESSPKQSQQSSSDPESPRSHEQLQLSQSSRPNPQPRSLEPGLSQTNPAPLQAPAKTLSSLILCSGSPPEAYPGYESTPSYEDAPVFMSSASISGAHDSALCPQATQCIPLLSSHLLCVTRNAPLALTVEEEEGLSIDSGDEMSSDSLALHEEGSSDEEAQTHRRLTRWRSREEAQGSPAVSHRGDSFVPTAVEKENRLQTDEPEQLSEPSEVVHNQSAGSGSEQFCDLGGFSSLSLDSGEQPDFDPTGSEFHGSSSNPCVFTEKHLVFKTMKGNNTTTPTRSGEISANELGTSGSTWSGTRILYQPPRTAPSPVPAPVVPSLSHSTRPPISASLSRPILGSELDPAFRPLSQAAQQIMEICCVDQTGCEDPDLDTDTTARTLRGLEQELRLKAKETGMQASVFGEGNSEGQAQHGNQHLTWDGVSEEQKEDEEAAQRDRQSVLSLP